MKEILASPLVPVLLPNWPMPKTVCACITLRSNIWEFALQAPNQPLSITALTDQLKLPSAPLFLKQVHGHKILNATLTHQAVTQNLEGDGWYSDQPQSVLGILTADCLPILLSDKTGHEISAVHGGWRGLASDILEKALDYFKSSREHIQAWIGPGIGYTAFEVGQEVYEEFTKKLQTNLITLDLAKCHPVKKNRWLLNLTGIATYQLNQLGLRKNQIFSENLCTFSNPQQFYSHRRNQEKGRMATLIWHNI